jgi:hypothetical protein
MIGAALAPPQEYTPQNEKPTLSIDKDVPVCIFAAQNNKNHIEKDFYSK